MPLDGLGTVGNSLPLNLPSNSLLTGTLADGTPFAISDQGVPGDYIPDGTLTLRAAAVPAALPTTYHTPGASQPRGLRAGQRLIVSDGAAVPENFNASWGSIVTLTGGEIGDNFEATGAIVNMTGGKIRELATAYMGSIVNLSGGMIGSNFTAATGSTVNISAGTVDLLFEAEDGSVVNFSGGAIKQYLVAHAGSRFNISGGEFRLNGVPVSGLHEVRASRPLNIPANTVLSGTLADGTPFAFSDQNYDFFADGTLTLLAAPLPASTPLVFHVPTEPAPKGLRTGQVLVVEDGGAIGDNFNAGWGTVVNLNGGQIGHDFEAVGALVNISSGTVGGRFDAFYGSVVNISGGTFEGVLTANRGSVVNIAGGSIGHYLRAYPGGIVNVAGGTIGAYASVSDGGVFNISGGSISDNFRAEGGTVNISGGSIGDEFQGYAGSTVNLSGGSIGQQFHYFGSGRVTLTGSEFRLDGSPVVGLQMYGPEVAINIPPGSVLSGTLADGTPFAFSYQDRDQFAVGSLRLQEWPTQPQGPATISVPGSQPPQGIRGGQALFVSEGGEVGDNFGAGWGSVVTIEGGRVGKNFEAVGCQVLIAGGSIGEGFDAFHGSAVTITGGSFGETSEYRHTSDFTAHNGSVVNISGGSFEPGFHAAAGSDVHLVGSAFFLNGMPIPGLLPGHTLEIAARDTWLAYTILSGVLLDGSEFSFRLNSEDSSSAHSDYFHVDSLLTVTQVLTADFNGDDVVNASDLARWKTSFAASVVGDSDGDLDSDGADFLAWQRQLGGHVAPTTTEIVPEPATMSLCKAMAIGFGLMRRRRHRSAAGLTGHSVVQSFH